MVDTTLKIRNKRNFGVPAPLPAYSTSSNIQSIHDLSALQPITN